MTIPETPQGPVQDFQWDLHSLQIVPCIQVETLPIRHTPNGGREGRGQTALPGPPQTKDIAPPPPPQNLEVLELIRLFCHLIPIMVLL